MHEMSFGTHCLFSGIDFYNIIALGVIHMLAYFLDG